MTKQISRRQFTRLSLAGTASLFAAKLQGMTMNPQVQNGPNRIRLGGPVWGDFKDPQEWIKALNTKGYSAAYCPVPVGTDEATVKLFETAAREADIIISEVGAWSNPLNKDENERNAAIKKCQDSLALADLIGARCCVNTSGSFSKSGFGPHSDNLTRDTFDLIVQSVREIIDAVKPVRSYYSLEPMPWMYPDSPDSYLDLIKAIDRKQMAVHLDPINMINSPSRFYNNGSFLKECFQKLGPYIKSCHAKDIILRDALMVHLDEVIIGTGGFDYKVYLTELSKLKDVPLMLEHLNTSEEYDQAAASLKETGALIGIRF